MGAQAYGRRALAILRLKRAKRAATSLAARARGVAARRAFDDEFRRRGVPRIAWWVRVQTLWRGSLQKRRYRRMLAATRLQAVYRLVRCVVAFRKTKAAAARIAPLCRALLAYQRAWKASEGEVAARENDAATCPLVGVEAADRPRPRRDLAEDRPRRGVAARHGKDDLAPEGSRPVARKDSLSTQATTQRS